LRKMTASPRRDCGFDGSFEASAYNRLAAFS
jgi:hypothetical protein